METINDSTLKNVLGGSQNLIPESLQTVIIVSFIVLNVVAVVFMAGYIFSVVRKWKVQTAILKMQRDVVDIKQSLNTLTNTGNPSTTNSAPEPVSSVIIEPRQDTSVQPLEESEMSEPVATPPSDQ